MSTPAGADSRAIAEVRGRPDTVGGIAQGAQRAGRSRSPGRFSTTTGCPSRCASLALTSRARTIRPSARREGHDETNLPGRPGGNVGSGGLSREDGQNSHRCCSERQEIPAPRSATACPSVFSRRASAPASLRTAQGRPMARRRDARASNGC